MGQALPPSVKLVPQEGVSVIEQLRTVLFENAVRVIDLFRDWDEDGNGGVDKKEFRKAIAALGYDAPRADVEVLFAAFDRDGSGEISRAEFAESQAAQRSADPDSLFYAADTSGDGKRDNSARLFSVGEW